MTNLTIRLSTIMPSGNEVYQETTLDQALVTDPTLTVLYAKLASDFAAYVKSQPA